MKLSVITTMYYSAPYFMEFYSRMSQAIQDVVGDDYEIIIVNDGSPDNSLQIALDIHAKDSHVTVVDLSRNFGQHNAIMSGLSFSKGDYVFLMDCDLEIEPESLEDFYNELHETNVDVVYGVQTEREDPLTARLFGSLFYQFFNKLSEQSLPQNLTIVRLMNRKYVEALLQYKERVFIIAGLWAHSGFEQIAIPVRKKHKGSTTYDFRRKLNFMVYSIIVFSNKPLIYIAILGLLMIIPSALWLIWLVFSHLFLGYGIEGWTSLMASLWLLGGVNIFFMGVVALYLSVIFEETKQRPRTIVKQVYKHLD